MREHTYSKSNGFLASTPSVLRTAMQAPEAFDDQRPVPVVERLIAADEQRRWLFGVEDRPEELHRFLGPVLWSSVCVDTKIETVGGNEHAIGILERSCLDPIKPDYESLAAAQKGLTRLRRRTDEIGDREAAHLDHLIAEPAHAVRVLDPVRLREAEVFVDVGTHVVGSRDANAFASVVFPAPGRP